MAKRNHTPKILSLATLGSPLTFKLDNVVRLEFLWTNGPKFSGFDPWNTRMIVSGERGRVGVPHLTHQPVNVVMDRQPVACKRASHPRPESSRPSPAQHWLWNAKPLPGSLAQSSTFLLLARWPRTSLRLSQWCPCGNASTLYQLNHAPIGELAC